MGRSKEEMEGVTLLGNRDVKYSMDYAPEMLQTFDNKPGEKMVESKSLKLYLFSFRNHGDFHEDCMNIIMKDLIKLMDPKYIEVWGKFTPRGGISIDPYCNYGRPGTKWEEVAWNRLANHDLYPEKVDNR